MLPRRLRSETYWAHSTADRELKLGDVGAGVCVAQHDVDLVEIAASRLALDGDVPDRDRDPDVRGRLLIEGPGDLSAPLLGHLRVEPL
jgi:hypothetical protein